MAAQLLDWLHLLARWTHVVAAILWIGDSFLFMWMDRSLAPPGRARPGNVVGELWMVHSGGFYEVVKRKQLAPEELPASLHWFKWEAYTTWISGVFLLGIVYYAGASLFLIDPAVLPMSPWAGIGVSVAFLIGGTAVYQALWRSPLGRRPILAKTIASVLMVGVVYALTHLFSARAAFLQAGAMLASIMAANVSSYIIPAQMRMLEATRAGRPVDTALGERAKLHSTINHYLTFPVVIAMLSNHFPALYGHPLAWVVLTLLFVFAVTVKYVMNFRASSNRWAIALAVVSLVALVVLTARRPATAGMAPDLRGAPAVSFAEAHAIIERRCQTCHARKPTNPSFPEPPSGIVLEDPARIRALAPRIMERAVVTKTMPLGNLTGMTEEERRTLGAWIAQGARIEETPR